MENICRSKQAPFLKNIFHDKWKMEIENII